MTTHAKVRASLLVELLLLLLLLGARMSVCCDEQIPLIQWEEACDSYEVTDGVYQRGPSIDIQYSTPLAQCRSRCTARRDCGGFNWSTGSSVFGTNNLCFLYNINDNIIDQYLSQNWYSNSSYMWYSKTCGYSLGDSDPSCNIYTEREYHNQSPDNKWNITYTVIWIRDLTATECQNWCTLYTGCRSVTYQRYNSDDGVGYCFLYNTTIQHLLDSGLDSNVTEHTGTSYTYTTYDRYCVNGTPYIPGQKITLNYLNSDLVGMPTLAYD